MRLTECEHMENNSRLQQWKILFEGSTTAKSGSTQGEKPGWEEGHVFN